ncbi:lactate/malate family dehydrogenase [Agromyces silvae]|uniref:lactate/malate family dehydrogenase n=1 Tax=Agromyces silvae TaxID=3388266 RepID=UPI00280A529A|nr:lactate dehydrogenase [Agromyces protaetiae]
MDVAVLGATGDVGRAVCANLIEKRVVRSTSRLQLVGRVGGPSELATHGLRADLIDAYDEHAPFIDVATTPDDVVADVIVLAAGATVPVDPSQVIDRDLLAQRNLATFREYAEALAAGGTGQEVVIVVSNPVELGVAVLAERLGRHRVIGMGSWLDTLRFRREIAADLGIHRQRVSGFVAGQHGDGAVPLWSTVRIRGFDGGERAAVVRTLRGERTLDTFAAEVAAAKSELAAAGRTDPGSAFAMVDTLRPGVRGVVRPYLTHTSGAKTSHATAAATVDLVDTVLDGREIVVAGQVALDGELELDGTSVQGVLGVPLVVGPDGWSRVLLDDLAPDEARRLLAISRQIRSSVDGWLSGVRA